jgi:hypothetical protein
VEHAGRYSTEFPCREKLVLAVYMAFSDEQHIYRPYIYAVWDYDAGCHAARLASALAYS